mgnify:CR=1 FL=1
MFPYWRIYSHDFHSPHTHVTSQCLNCKSRFNNTPWKLRDFKPVDHKYNWNMCPVCGVEFKGMIPFDKEKYYRRRDRQDWREKQKYRKDFTGIMFDIYERSFLGPETCVVKKKVGPLRRNQALARYKELVYNSEYDLRVKEYEFRISESRAVNKPVLP